MTYLLSIAMNLLVAVTSGAAVYYMDSYGVQSILLAFAAGLMVGMNAKWQPLSITESTPQPGQESPRPSLAKPTPAPVRHTPRTPPATSSL